MLKRGLARAVPLLATVSVLSVAATARADWLSDLSAPVEEALTSGSWLVALGFIYLAGLVTSLTPCVYPMIAITVSVFGASEAKTKLHAAGLSSMYVLGIGALFAPLGLVVALMELDTSALYGSGWFWGGMAALLIGLSLGMFGVFELRLPYSIQNRLAQMGGLGPKGAFALGLAGGLIATPCTGPVLTGLLAWISTSGNPAFGALALFTFAMGLGTLTWVVGTFAVSLPKSGMWMEHVKSVLGSALVITGLFFLFNNALPSVGDLVERTPLWLGIAIGAVVVGIGMGAIHLSFHGTSKAVMARKIGGLLLTSLGGVAIVLWINAPPLGATIEWMDDYEAAVALAEAENRPLLVDFGASWCGACEEMERHTFSDPRVVREGGRFVPVRVDLSPGEDVAAGQRLLAQYNQRGLPLVVFHDAEGEEAARITAFVEAEQMLQTMRDVR